MEAHPEECMVVMVLGLAHAQEVSVVGMPPGTVVDEAGASGRSTRDSGSSSSSSDDGDKKKKSKKSEKKKFMGWTYEPYVQPGGGVRIDSTNGVAVEAGADVGVKYWKDNWVGDLYAGGAYATGSSYSGYEIHLGDTFGRREKYWGLGIGVEGFYNGYVDTDGSDILAPSVGIDVPVSVTIGPKKYYGYGGVTPSFLFNRERHVDGLPFGDELEWEVGAGLKFEGLKVTAGFNQRITVAGTINTPTLSVSIGG